MVSWVFKWLQLSDPQGRQCQESSGNGTQNVNILKRKVADSLFKIWIDLERNAIFFENFIFIIIVFLFFC